MRAVTWTQVAQYIILIIAYLVPVVWLSVKQTGVPIPQAVYGFQLQKVTELEKKLNADPKELEVLVALIDRRRSELQLAAQRLGQRLYAEKPSAFVSRLETYWQVWQLETAQPMLIEV